MKEFNYKITDEQGIHARPAGLLVKEASKFDSSITIECRGKTVDAKKIFSLMSLGAKCGDIVTVKIDGTDESITTDEIQSFFNNNL